MKLPVQIMTTKSKKEAENETICEGLWTENK
jgi:hypothetical protein